MSPTRFITFAAVLPIRALAVALACAPAAAGSGIPDVSPPPGTLPTVAPDAILPIDPDLWIRGLTVSPDGTRAYVRATLPTVNVWAYAVGWWPELLGAPLLLWLLFRLRRNLRLRPAAGEDHCRNCGYLVRGLTRDQCPECGTALTAENRVRGADVHRRIAALAASASALLIGYAILHGRLPRSGGPAGLLSIRSTTLYHWSLGGHSAADPIIRGPADDLFQPRDVVVEIDLATGRVVRTLRDRPSRKVRLGIVRSPDGKSLFVDDELSVDEVELSAGSTVRTFAAPGRLERTVAVTDDGRTLYSGDWSYGVHSSARFEFVAWDLDTGELTDRLQGPSESGILPPEAGKLRRPYVEPELGSTVFRPPPFRAATGDAWNNPWEFVVFDSAPSIGVVRDAKSQRHVAGFPVPPGAELWADGRTLIAFNAHTLHVFDVRKLSAAGAAVK